MAVVIAPMHTTHTRNCVVEAGVRYCEDQPLTKPGALLLGIGLLVWVTAIVVAHRWVEADVSRPFWPEAVALGLPLIVGVIGMIVWGLS